MWQANKVGIVALIVGLLLLGGVFVWLRERDEALAQQVLALGFCALLFAVAMGTWISVRRELIRCRKEAEAQEEQDAPRE